MAEHENRTADLNRPPRKVPKVAPGVVAGSVRPGDLAMDSTADPVYRPDPGVVAVLNDLLQLDHDAVAVYSLAIAALEDPSLKEALTRHRTDHERHVRDLTALVEASGQTPFKLPHIPTGGFKLAVQAMATFGGDRGILLAFKANEGQVRNKYARHAERAYPPAIADTLRRNADDEARHYAWVVDELDRLGLGTGTAPGAVSSVFEAFHGAAADFVEATNRRVMFLLQFGSGAHR